jgi:hypothetical protein
MRSTWSLGHLIIVLFCMAADVSAQNDPIESDDEPAAEQIEHISPVFDDLTTDLGARTGENELNVNFGYRRYLQ